MARAWAKDLVIAEEIGAAVEREKPKTEGVEENFDVAVTDDQNRIVPTKPCFSYAIVNDGPDPVYYFINEYEEVNEQSPIMPREEVHGDFGRPKIRCIIFRCGTGDNASVRAKLQR